MWVRKQQYPCQPVCLVPKRRQKAICLPSPQIYTYPCQRRQAGVSTSTDNRETAHHLACRTVGPAAGSGTPAVLAGNSPVYGPGWKSPLVVAQGVAGKPGLFLPGRTVYFCPFQPPRLGEEAVTSGFGQTGGPALTAGSSDGDEPVIHNQRATIPISMAPW